ncbi:MBOAT family O-acyltransferase [Sphingomonas sp.]|uniref:MBOAT family O-acyltransferase n=1 Tax=Sphingomonas sp. TaxID=28214 RepID=UPI003AFFC0F8
MTVPSFLFLAFAAVAAALHGLSGSKRWRMAVMLLANLGFLLSFSHRPLALAPYLGFLAIGYALVRLVGANASARIQAGAVTTIVAAFLWLKHYSFVPDAVLLPFSYATVGLSYVFFRVLHLAIAAREEPEAAGVGPVEYVNYTLNFTALVSGPIQGFEDYKRMTDEEPAPLGLDEVGLALERIVTGMFQFTVMAALVSLVQRDVAALLVGNLPLMERAFLTALLTAAYPVFLFFNFAGYTSFVIGVARFFQLELPENFNQPFRATSFIDYWSRWHMSLSNWLKAHVYNPLLLNSARRLHDPGLVPILNVAALFVTFFLIGLWHGPTWHFVVFGVFNGAGVAVNQFYRLAMQKRLGTGGFLKLGTHPIYVFVSRGATFAWVAFTLLWFWSDGPELSGFAQRLGPLGLAAAGNMLVIGACLIIALLLAAQHLAGAVGFGGRPLVTSPYLRTMWVTLMLLAVIASNVATAGDAGEVVYKSF